MRSWTWNYNLNLCGQDHFPVGEMITSLPMQRDYPIQILTLVGGPSGGSNSKPPKPKPGALPPGRSSIGLPPIAVDTGWRS